MVSFLSKKQSTKLIMLCWLVYSSAYFGRLNYSANLVRIVGDLEISKSEGGLVSSCFFFAYCGGQLFHGFMNRYYDPRWIILFSLIGSAVINMLFPLCSSILPMCILWMINGFLQAILWTTLCRTLSRYLDNASMKRSILAMGTTTAIGTALTYGISALFINILGWKFSFFFASVVMATVGILWFFYFHHLVCDIPERQNKVELQQIAKHKMGKVFILLIATICFFGIINNLIRDGLTTWSPSIFYELHHLPDSLSIFLTLGLPLLSTLGSFVCVKVHQKIRDYVKLCSVFFSIAAVFILIMILCLPLNVWAITLVCFAAAALMMSSVNNCITSVVPMELRDMADSGAVAGVTNTFCYIGSTLSTYLLGAIVDRSGGWNNVFYFLFSMCLLASAICGIYVFMHLKLAVDKKRKI